MTIAVIIFWTFHAMVFQLIHLFGRGLAQADMTNDKYGKKHRKSDYFARPIIVHRCI